MHPVIFQLDDATVGDCHLVGVASEILDDHLRPGVRRRILAVNHPIPILQGCSELIEHRLVRQVPSVVVELQTREPSPFKPL